MQKYNNSPFSDRNHKHVIHEGLQIIKDNIFRKHFIERPTYNFNSYVLCYVSKLEVYFEHVVNKFFFVKWIYDAEDRADQVITHLAKKLYIYI